MAVVYTHTRCDTGDVFYVGIGKDESRSRSKSRKNKHWFNIINKTKYIIDIVFDNLSWEDACIKEIELIGKYGRKDLGKGTLCNHTDGGDGTLNHKSWNIGKHLSHEHKMKISVSNKGRRCSEETKRKISKSWDKGWMLSELSIDCMVSYD